MTLKQWMDNGWLRPHKTSAEEIENLFMIIDRDLKDAKGGISDDWRFGIAYNAALKLCTILLYAEGFKAEKTLQHYRTIHEDRDALHILSLLMGEATVTLSGRCK